MHHTSPLVTFAPGFTLALRFVLFWGADYDR
jgi:hypothetical protein